MKIQHNNFVLILFTFVYFFLNSIEIKAQNVLILYDDSITNPNTLSLKQSLESRGLNVQFSEVIEHQWNNTNPSLNSIDAVIHLNGSSYHTNMSDEAQSALSNFVENEQGLYIGFEWNTYQFSSNNVLQNLDELILFDYLGYVEGSDEIIRISQVPELTDHPVLQNIPPYFDLLADYNQGRIRTFENYPSTVLMTHNTNDALAIRHFNTGYVLNFHHAVNYYYPNLHDENVQKIIGNFITEYAQESIVNEPCLSRGKRSNFEWIKEVKLGSNLNIITPGGNHGYGDFTDQILNVNGDENVLVELNPGYKKRAYTEFWRIWIDFNQDGDFSDDGEMVFQNSGKHLVSGHFTIPEQISSGEYKIRTSMKWKSFPPSCGEFLNGEVRDFKINLTTED